MDNGDRDWPTEREVTVGSVWRGISGNLLVIRSVENGQASWVYLSDPDDGSTDAAADIAAAMELVPGCWTNAIPPSFIPGPMGHGMTDTD